METCKVYKIHCRGRWGKCASQRACHYLNLLSHRLILTRSWSASHRGAWMLLRTQPKWISEIEWTIVNVCVEVDAALRPDRVLGQEATGSGVVVPGPIVGQTRFGIELAPSVLQWVGERARRSCYLTVGIVGVS